MGDGQLEERSHTRFWTALGGLLAIFASAFAVVTFVLPVDGTLSRLLLSGIVLSVSALLYQGMVAALKRRLNWRAAALMFATLVLVVGYAQNVIADREGQVGELRKQLEAAGKEPVAGVGATPSSQPSVSKKPTGSPTPAPGSGLPPFDQTSAEVRVNGTTALNLDDRLAMSSSLLTLQHQPQGIAGLNGSVFALVPAGEKRTFETCRDQQTWQTTLNWDELSRGAFVCVNLHDRRRGMFRIDEMPNLDANEPKISITWVTWEKIVG